MKSKDLVNLMLSPPWISRLLHHFLSGVQKVNSKGIKTELLFLSIPFITDEVTRNSLLKAVSTSTFSSIFYKNDTLEIKNSLSQKRHQIKQYREFTNRGLIYLGNIVTLEIGKFISVNTVTTSQKELSINRDYCRAAYYLGIIFAKEDYRNVFVKLGIMNI